MTKNNGLKEKLIDSKASIELVELEEQKHPVIPINNTQLIPTPAKLRYLHTFNEKELKELEKQYDRTRQQLDAATNEYFGVFLTERILNWFACGVTGGLVIGFVINTSNEAFVNLVQLIPGATIPSAVSNSISIPIAVISTGLFFVVFSCQKEAVKTVLAYAYRKPIKISGWEELQRARHYPVRVMLDTTQLLTNYSIMLLTNLTAALPAITNIMDPLVDLPTPLNGAVIGTILYLGGRFFGTYMDSNYINGLEFFRQLWRGEKKHSHVAGTLETVLQVLSSTILRVFPYYYWLALKADEAFWWPPAYLVSIAVAIHSIALFYPSAFNYFFADQEQLGKLLSEKFQRLTGVAREHAIEAERTRLTAQVIEKFGRFFLLKKDKMVNPVLAYDTFIGGYIGYELGLLSPIDSAAFPVIGSLVFASLFSGLLYKAEEKRVSQKLCCAMLEEKPENVPAKMSLNENLAEVAGNAINITTAASIVTSIISTGSSLAKDLPLLRSAIYLGAGKRGLNIIQFNRDKIITTVRGLVAPGNIFKSTRACFFRQPELERKEAVGLPIVNGVRVSRGVAK